MFPNCKSGCQVGCQFSMLTTTVQYTPTTRAEDLCYNRKIEIKLANTCTQKHLYIRGLQYSSNNSGNNL